MESEVQTLKDQRAERLENEVDSLKSTLNAALEREKLYIERER